MNGQNTFGVLKSIIWLMLPGLQPNAIFQHDKAPCYNFQAQKFKDYQLLFSWIEKLVQLKGS